MPPKRLKLPKPQPSAKKSRGKSNHKGNHLQLWSVENMRNALVLYISQRAPGYKGKVHGYKCVADAHHIPRETFWHRVKGPLTGLFGYLAGGKGLTLEFPKLVHHLKWGKFCIFSVLFHFRIHISAASISSKIVGTVHLFLSQLCNFIYIWCEAPVSEYVLNSCNNFYLKTSLYHFRPQAIQDSHPDSSSQAPANAIYVQPTIDWGQYILSKGCQRSWNSDCYIM